MSKFITKYKTSYTDIPVSSGEKEFIPKYTSKYTRKIISGKDRTGKRFTSRLIQ